MSFGHRWQSQEDPHEQAKAFRTENRRQWKEPRAQRSFWHQPVDRSRVVSSRVLSRDSNWTNISLLVQYIDLIAFFATFTILTNNYVLRYFGRINNHLFEVRNCNECSKKINKPLEVWILHSFFEENVWKRLTKKNYPSFVIWRAGCPTCGSLSISTKDYVNT